VVAVGVGVGVGRGLDVVGRGAGVVADHEGAGLGAAVALRRPGAGEVERPADGVAEAAGAVVDALGRAVLGSAEGRGAAVVARGLGDVEVTGGSVGAPRPTTSAGPVASEGTSSPPE